MEHFNKLFQINVNDKTEKKNGLTYLSWGYAWAEVKKLYPDATYKIWRDENGLPYVYDENTGYMVFTEMTIEGVTHQMWLPVMDGANKSMKNKPYTYFVKDYKTGGQKEKTVDAATMFDVNKTIMRCLVKNMGMFGLGLYIYNGEDLPEDLPVPINDTQALAIKTMLEETNADVKAFLGFFKVNSVEEMDTHQYGEALRMLNKKKGLAFK